MKPEVLCIQPPVYDFALYDLYFKPYGLLRIARWLKDAGYRVRMINALDYDDPRTSAVLGWPRRKTDGTGKFHRARTELPPGISRINRHFARYGILPEVLETAVRDARPDISLVTSQMTYWYPGVAETVRAVKKHHPEVPVVVGGVYASLMPEHCRTAAGADEVVNGDAFRELRRILERRGLPAPADPSPGDPAPLLAPEVWKDAGVVRLNTGCPFRCTYCASRSIEPRFKPGDYQRTFALVREMHERLRIRNFAFYDDALLINKEQVLLPLLEEILRHGLDLRFYTPNAVHMHYIDDEAARMMKRAGFQEVRIGYESADDAFHRELDAKYTPEEVPKAIEALRRAGFKGRQLILYVLAGLPGQRVSEVERTLREVKRFKVRVSIAEYSPVPRTALWDQAVEASPYPLEDEPLYHNNTFFPMEWEGFTRADLERVKESARLMETE